MILRLEIEMNEEITQKEREKRLKEAEEDHEEYLKRLEEAADYELEL